MNDQSSHLDNAAPPQATILSFGVRVMIADNNDGGRSSLGAQCVRFIKLTSPDLIPAKRNEILRNTRKTGRSVGDPPHDPCPPPEK